jgi:hypothetical protein
MTRGCKAMSIAEEAIFKMTEQMHGTDIDDFAARTRYNDAVKIIIDSFWPVKEEEDCN